ncbi:MAG: methylated-DNA--[protein]-cysteine S-methyltransferase [Syntrophobacteraceae bacterium]
MSAEFELEYLVFETPLGWMVVAATSEGVSLVDFMGHVKPPRERIESLLRKEYPGAEAKPSAGPGPAQTAATHILDYLDNRKPLPGVPLDVRRGTEFEHRVWQAISAIPFGETRSYKQIAEAAGNPAGARAAGRACGRNPVPIIIPCHRVTTAAGRLGGFSGGLDIKRALLDLEKTL